jgi:asparagine synthase (glutamine-hydrolysing)
MGVPTTDWCLGPLRREVARWLSPRRLQQDGWFELAAVRALCRGEDHPGEFRRRRVGERLWALLMLQVWREVACGRSAERPVSGAAARNPGAAWQPPMGAARP